MRIGFVGFGRPCPARGPWHPARLSSGRRECTQVGIVAQKTVDYVHQLAADRTEYQALLQKAKDLTFKAPGGQLHGRAGRRCVLEDGERVLLQCLRVNPSGIEARTTLMYNLTAQNRGRELEVPRAALEALQHTKLRGCRPQSAQAATAVLIVKLGLAALRKGQRSGDSFQRFIVDALKLVPDLAEAVLAMAEKESFVTPTAGRRLSLNDSCDGDLM